MRICWDKPLRFYSLNQTEIGLRATENSLGSSDAAILIFVVSTNMGVELVE